MLSAAMWLLYLYLIRDALMDLSALVTDTFEWTFAGAERPRLPAITRVLATLEEYGAVALLNGATLIVWALYNQVRFRGSDRRGASKLVGVADLAALYGFPAEDIANWQQSRILVMRHGPGGVLIRVTSQDPEPIPPLPHRESPAKAAE